MRTNVLLMIIQVFSISSAYSVPAKRQDDDSLYQKCLTENNGVDGGWNTEYEVCQCLKDGTLDCIDLFPEYHQCMKDHGGINHWLVDNRFCYCNWDGTIKC
ncbi:hypothetical protein BB559_002424 [Furculomyces boomerangus]|uniref:Extracellular membrane protein CFEM domain-containing protein n=1 Tax=Furculomyces boomerangus TaxID=61424 RepID=A0A2T9YVA9_9FUNG|nr:hypothetical protein BB559_002424 [Furculomyces boomerangus]